MARPVITALICAFLAVTAFAPVASAQTTDAPEPTALWAMPLGENDAPEDQIDGVAVDNNGNTLISGIFLNELVFGGQRFSSRGMGDIFVASIARNGTANWVRQFGAGSDDNTYDLTADAAGNIYISGWFGGTVDFGGTRLTAKGQLDAFVAKLSPSGEVIWARRFGGVRGDGGNEIAVTAAGEVAMSVISEGPFEVDGRTIPFGGGRRDAHVVRLDTNGNVRWTHTFDGSGMERMRAITIGQDGTVYAGFQFNGELASGGNRLVARDGWDGALAKLSPNGQLEWMRQVGGNGRDNVRGAGIDQAGNVYAVGVYETDAFVFDREYLAHGTNGTDFIVKLSPSGQVLWTITTGGDGYNSGSEIVVDRRGPIISSLAIGDVDFRLNGSPLHVLRTGTRRPTGYLIGFNTEGAVRFAFMPEPVGRDAAINGNSLGVAFDGRHVAQSFRFTGRSRIGGAEIYTSTRRESAIALFAIDR